LALAGAFYLSFIPALPAGRLLFTIFYQKEISRSLLGARNSSSPSGATW
jgi:hypothetical protein